MTWRSTNKTWIHEQNIQKHTPTFHGTLMVLMGGIWGEWWVVRGPWDFGTCTNGQCNLTIPLHILCLLAIELPFHGTFTVILEAVIPIYPPLNAYGLVLYILCEKVPVLLRRLRNCGWIHGETSLVMNWWLPVSSNVACAGKSTNVSWWFQ